MAEPRFDLARCLERVAGRDQAAARELVERCHPLVLRIVRAHLPRSHTADDLAQEVYLKMFTRLDRYSPRDGIPFEHWLSRLAVRTCLDVLKAERRRPRLEQPRVTPGERDWIESLRSDREPPLEDALAARQAAERLLGELAAPDRLVLTLVDLEGYGTAEVAALTGWSRAGVKVRTFRARRRLRAAARALGLGPAPEEEG